jgi:glycosyltransferase involved in cell wall biosynthesis
MEPGGFGKENGGIVMNIFFLTETESGCYKWRGAIPAKYLRQRGHTVEIFSDDFQAYETPDVLVIFRAHYPNVFKLVEWCKKRKIRVVFDTDDALDLVPKQNVNYRGLQDRLDLYDFLIENADVVTTTTPLLAADLRERNPHVVVLPNSADPEEWKVLPRQSGVRVGWTGSATHFHDLAVALPALRELQKRIPFTFVLQGICDDPSLTEFYQRLVDAHGKAFSNTPLGKSIKRFLAELAGIRYEFYPMVEFARHSQTVCDLALDIGIAPLVEDSFNQHKSCIKYYEYALSGAITVASRVLPYSTEVPITAKNSRQSWKDTLEPLLAVNNGAGREAIWREQRDWVLEHRNMGRNVTLWEQVYRGELTSSTIAADQNAAA